MDGPFLGRALLPKHTAFGGAPAPAGASSPPVARDQHLLVAFAAATDNALPAPDEENAFSRSLVLQLTGAAPARLRPQMITRRSNVATRASQGDHLTAATGIVF